MIRAFILSVAQLGDRRILIVFAKSMAATMVLFLTLGVLAWLGIDAVMTRWFASTSNTLTGAFAVFTTMLALWLLFRAFAIATITVFADDVVEAVEARHYPEALANARTVPMPRAIGMAIRSTVRVVVVNLVLAPVYVVLLVTGIGTALAFFVVNGWLLGRDLGDMVAARHLDAEGVAAWRRVTGPRRFLLGLGDAALFVVPGVAFVAPVLGAAMATHLFHRTRT